jgi:hypothetical protein
MEVGILIASLLGIIVWMGYRIAKLQNSVNRMSEKLNKLGKYYSSHKHTHVEIFSKYTSQPVSKEDAFEDDFRKYH